MKPEFSKMGALVITLGLVGCGQTADEGPSGMDDAAADPSSTTTPGEGATGSSTGADPGGASGPGTTAATSTAGATGEDMGDGDEGIDPPLYDVGGVPDGGGDGFCAAPPQVHCDHQDDDPWHAFSLNCPGGPQVDGTIDLTGPAQLYVHQGNLGTFAPPPFPPREGDKFVILSSGAAQDLTIPGHYASTSISGADTPLPPPLQPVNVSATQDCYENPGLVGTGDCSNTIQEQWDQGSGAHDYAEMRFTTTVPLGTFGFTYDFAMFSTEYPVFYQSSFNDMYIAWLESEQWTGNISFDDMGHPISLNAGFLDYKDAPNMYDCPAPCQAPELQGTAMQGHAGTRWLTTTAGVTPGETIELVLAVFDLTDSILDTVILLDNFQWACEGGAPVTIPG